jgi:peroxiredoxin
LLIDDKFQIFAKNIKNYKMNQLAKQIEQLNEHLVKQLPDDIMIAFEQSIIDLKESYFENNVIRHGEQFPIFLLPNIHNELVKSEEILKKGKMIVAFYRGSWCPYCSLELKALQENLKRFQEKGATLIAISPQKPDTATFSKDYKLQFEVLTDINNNLAKRLGIAFYLQEFVLPSYEKLGINLSQFNENNDYSLPIPAVFVVDQTGTIVFRFADANYINRIDIEELIAAL